MNSLIYKGAEQKAYKNRFNSEEDYFQFEKIKGRKILKIIRSKTDLRGKTILDVGCGYGGIIAAFLEDKKNKNSKIIGLDINKELTSFCKKKFPKQKFITADATNIPLKTESVDIAILADVIEHVDNPAKCIAEVKRILKKGGIAYINFPPYYGPWGGHLKPPLTHPIPYLHYLPEKILKRYVSSRKRKWKPLMIHLNSSATEGFNLNKMTISRIDRIIRKNRLKIIYKKNELAMPWRLPAIRTVARTIDTHFHSTKEVFSGTYSLIIKKS
jgi:ubiquinone/menaquinone biosynthesis C-methylase UbiE